MLRINACIVLYGTKISDSETYKTMKKYDSLKFFEKIFIYCNSDNLIDIEKCYLPSNFVIIQNSVNNFLFENYTDALNRSIESGVDYLITLDQDSKIPKDYFQKLTINIIKYPLATVFYPRIINESKSTLSPIFHSKKFLTKNIDQQSFSSVKYVAINSCSVLKVTDFNRYDLLDSDFPLDYLDHMICYNIYIKGLTFVIIDSNVIHNLSVNTNLHIPEGRALSILRSEKLFICKSSGKKARIFYNIKMFLRLCYALFNRNYKYSPLTIIKVLQE